LFDSGERDGRGFLLAAGLRLQELGNQGFRDMRILERAEQVLQRSYLLNETGGFRPQDVAEELQRVAQPLAIDTQEMVGGQRRLGNNRFVRADRLVARENQPCRTW